MTKEMSACEKLLEIEYEKAKEKKEKIERTELFAILLLCGIGMFVGWLLGRVTL